MSRLVIVVEKLSDWGSYYPSENVVAALDYLKRPAGAHDDEIDVIANLAHRARRLEKVSVGLLPGQPAHGSDQVSILTAHSR